MEGKNQNAGECENVPVGVFPGNKIHRLISVSVFHIVSNKSHKPNYSTIITKSVPVESILYLCKKSCREIFVVWCFFDSVRNKISTTKFLGFSSFI